MFSGVGLKAATIVAGAVLLAACGKTENEAGSPTGTLCFDYFQQCVYPLALDTQFPVDPDNDGVFELRRCSDSGCHLSSGNSGGALRLSQNATTIPLQPPSDPDNPPPMYTNFVSAKGQTDLNNGRQSNLIRKPLLEIPHNGGRVFASDQDAAARQIMHWINNRVPAGGNEFAPFCASLFAAGNTCQP